jgi:hypothetical protein
VEAVAENQLPIWRSMAIIPLLAVMLKCAGVTFSSDQNIAFGDMLAGGNGVGPAARVMDYCTFALLLALSFLAIAASSRPTTTTWSSLCWLCWRRSLYSGRKILSSRRKIPFG